MSPLRLSHVYPITRGRHFAAHTPSKPPPTRRGATCDARPTAGRQRNRPHACARHPGDMNVAPTCIPTFITRHQPARPAFRRRHPGDMNVAPTCILRLSPRLSHATNPRGRRRALLLYMCPYDRFMRAAPAFPFCQEKKKKQAGTLSFLIFIAKFGAVAVGSPAETPREIMENITKKLKRAYNPIQLFNSLKTTIMRKTLHFLAVSC